MAECPSTPLEKARAALEAARELNDPSSRNHIYLLEAARIQASIATAEAAERQASALEEIVKSLDYWLPKIK